MQQIDEEKLRRDIPRVLFKFGCLDPVRISMETGLVLSVDDKIDKQFFGLLEKLVEEGTLTKKRITEEQPGLAETSYTQNRYIFWLYDLRTPTLKELFSEIKQKVKGYFSCL